MILPPIIQADKEPYESASIITPMATKAGEAVEAEAQKGVL